MRASGKAETGTRSTAFRRGRVLPSLRHRVTGSLSALAVLAACAGCAQYGVTETKYFTIEHAFTDAAAARAQKDAEGMCAQKKLVAVKTSGACTLTRCTTHFQCMNKADAGKYQP